MRPESFMRFVLLTAAVCLAVPIVVPSNPVLVFGAFIVFEMCVGMFWPAMGFMRGIYVPESTRATVMNFFRVPLNLIVVGILLQNLPMHVIFECCVAFLLLAAVAQQWMHGLALTSGYKPSTMPSRDAGALPNKSALLNGTADSI